MAHRHPPEQLLVRGRGREASDPMWLRPARPGPRAGALLQVAGEEEVVHVQMDHPHARRRAVAAESGATVVAPARPAGPFRRRRDAVELGSPDWVVSRIRTSICPTRRPHRWRTPGRSCRSVRPMSSSSSASGAGGGKGERGRESDLRRRVRDMSDPVGPPTIAAGGIHPQAKSGSETGSSRGRGARVVNASRSRDGREARPGRLAGLTLCSITSPRLRCPRRSPIRSRRSPGPPADRRRRSRLVAIRNAFAGSLKASTRPRDRGSR